MSRLLCKLNVTNLDLDAKRKDFMCFHNSKFLVFLS